MTLCFTIEGNEKSLVLADCCDFDEENEPPWTLSRIYHVNILEYNVLLYSLSLNVHDVLHTLTWLVGSGKKEYDNQEFNREGLNCRSGEYEEGKHVC